jgi:hypothetical protein
MPSNRSKPGTRRRFLATAVVVLLFSLAARPVHAIEATVFVSNAFPSELWGSGLGASLTSTWFKLVMLDAELARQNYEVSEGRLLSFSVAACLAPSFGRLTPYAGFGVGLHRQTFGEFGDNGTHTSLIVGGKLRFGLLVLRAEYRTFELGASLPELDHRVYAGAGISF